MMDSTSKHDLINLFLAMNLHHNQELKQDKSLEKIERTDHKTKEHKTQREKLKCSDKSLKLNQQESSSK